MLWYNECSVNCCVQDRVLQVKAVAKEWFKDIALQVACNVAMCGWDPCTTRFDPNSREISKDLTHQTLLQHFTSNTSLSPRRLAYVVSQNC